MNHDIVLVWSTTVEAASKQGEQKPFASGAAWHQIDSLRCKFTNQSMRFLKHMLLPSVCVCVCMCVYVGVTQWPGRGAVARLDCRPAVRSVLLPVRARQSSSRLHRRSVGEASAHVHAAAAQLMPALVWEISWGVVKTEIWRFCDHRFPSFIWKGSENSKWF